MMGDQETTSASETMESLEERHRKQKKDLQSRIQSLKKTVTKGDRKKKKEVDTEIENLEKEFEVKCKLELEEFQKNHSASSVASPPEKTVVSETEIPNVADGLEYKENTKVTKSKKRREKKEKEDQEREKMIALQEIENKKGPAYIELTKIKEKLKQKGLEMKEMISDGNCMYYAIADQLDKHLSIKKSCLDLRELTCDYMLKHADDFKPYIPSEDDDFIDDEKYTEYCHKIKETLVWGSQVELKALSEIFKILIEVVQAEGSEILLGDQNLSKEKLIITYHRYILGSGEHFNSTQPLKEEQEDQ